MSAKAPSRGISLQDPALGLLTFVVALLPWGLGGNRTPLLLVAATLLAIAAGLALLANYRSTIEAPLYLALWLPFAVVAIWLSPLASEFKRPFIEAVGLQVGHDIELESRVFVQALAGLLVAACVFVTCRSPRAIRFFIFAVIGSSALQVIYAVYLINGGDRLFYWPQDSLRVPAGHSVASANFANRNHFAGHLEMVLFLTFGVLVGKYLQNSRRQQQGSRAARISAYILGPEGRLRAVMVLLTIGIVMTQSRTGNIALATTLCFAFAMLYYRFTKARPAIIVLFASILIVDVAIVSNLVGLERVAERISDTRVETELRPDFNQLSMAMLSDYWLTGIGGGNYVSFVRGYQDLDLELYFIYAHNDILQFALELGLPVFSVLVLYVVLSILAGLKAYLHRTHMFYSGVGLGAACAVISLTIHAFTDYNHQIPANAFLFVICTCLCWLCLYNDRSASSGSKPKNKAVQ